MYNVWSVKDAGTTAATKDFEITISVLYGDVILPVISYMILPVVSR